MRCGRGRSETCPYDVCSRRQPYGFAQGSVTSGQKCYPTLRYAERLVVIALSLTPTPLPLVGEGKDAGGGRGEC